MNRDCKTLILCMSLGKNQYLKQITHEIVTFFITKTM